ncbi:MAG TPA: hypothetical protein PKD55_04185 [Bellilinea sp.]|nr:hypothetical protein [Bellilinea sp.]
MVKAASYKPSLLYKVTLLIAALLIAGSFLISPASAQSYSFQVPSEEVIATINPDGTVDLEYTITFKNDNGAPSIEIVDIGMPSYAYNIGNMSAELNGEPANDIRDSEYVHPGVEIHLPSGIRSGDTGTLHFVAQALPNMFGKSDVSGAVEYTSLVFAPNYFDPGSVGGNTDMTVHIVLPADIKGDEPKYHTPSGNWPGAAEPEIKSTPDGRAVYTWHAQDAKASVEYQFGASIPSGYVPTSIPQPTSQYPTAEYATSAPFASNSTDWFSILMCLCPIGIVVLAIVGIFAGIKGSANRKMQYLPPKISVVGHGIKRGLTAVEAAILMEQPLSKVFSMILFSVIKKGAAQVVAREPETMLKLADPLPADLQPYEIEFLQAYDKKDDKDRRKGLQDTVVNLVKAVGEKMKGFSKQETIAYYTSIMEKAWSQVQAADTPEIKSSTYEQVMDWTMLDKDWGEKTQETFSGQTVFLPRWWGHYDPTYQSAGPSTTTSTPGTATMPTFGGGQSTTSTPGGSVSMPSLPGAAFAASVVQGAQNFAAGAIGNLESFTGAVTNRTNPVPPPTHRSSGGRGGWGGGGGFSSGHSSCACACACAGCACACAGGGR